MVSQNTELIIQERLIQPSSVTPTLFIGLGGCGLRIVQRVKHHLEKHQDYDEKFKALTKFMAFDTNINDLEKARKDMDDVVLLSDFEKEDYARLANGQLFLEPDDYFTQWVPENYRFRAGDTAGAGQIRIESRLGLYYQTKHRDVVSRLRRQLENLKDHTHGHRRLDSSEIRIVLCYSVAGGTGSGSHLPMAYLVRDLAAQLGKPRVFGVSVLPSVFEDKTGRNKDGIFANGYAALKEVEHLMKLGSPEGINYPTEGIHFHYNPADPSKRVVKRQPFEFVYIIDRPEKFSVSDVEGAAADGLYLQFFSPIFGHQAGDYDNYTQHQRGLVPLDFASKGVKGFTSLYGSYGAAVLLVPTSGLVKYCSKAAALDILRSNFVSAIPSAPQYNLLRLDPEAFNRADFVDADGEPRSVNAADLRLLSAQDRQRAQQSLFQRRIRLLARADYDQKSDSNRRDYLEIWRHGHGEAFVSPSTDPHKPGETGASKGSFNFATSIVGGIEKSIGLEGRDFETGGLLNAHRSIFRRAWEDVKSSQLNKDSAEDNLHPIASTLNERFEMAFGRALRAIQTGNDPNMLCTSHLKQLTFLTDPDLAQSVDLRAQRYAFLQLADHQAFKSAEKFISRGFNASEPESLELVEMTKKGAIPFSKEKTDEEAVERNLAATESYAEKLIVYYETKLRFAYAKELVEVHSRFVAYERQLAAMESGFDELERAVSRQLDQIRNGGDDQTNQYVLDSEALQMENGRRLWDYFYEDRYADRAEFKISHPEINRLISQRLITRSQDDASRLVGGRQVLESMIQSIESHTREILKREIEGILGHRDELIRNGYTLDEALRDEIRYRALHLSNNAGDGEQSRLRIQQALSRFAAKSEEKRSELVNLSLPAHRDYLRDKVKRLINERAQILCYYEDSRDQQGGVRPCHVFVGSLHGALRHSDIGDLITGKDLVPDAKIQWVNDTSNGLRQIVFYRAVLNVPLYVFGRLKELQADYHAFRNMSKRPKVLHIDKNWEDTLQDLDPEAAIDFHRKENLRRQIIGFAALFTVHRAMGSASMEPIIAQMPGRNANDDSYWILRPALNSSVPSENSAPVVASEDVEIRGNYQKLGKDLREAIANLPILLRNNPIPYNDYQKLINNVRAGKAPRVMQEICELAFTWRQQFDSLRERYGRSPDDRQQVRLRDLEEASKRLSEALKDQREALAEIRDEYVSSVDVKSGAFNSLSGQSGDSVQAEVRAVADSVELLDNFAQRWAIVENPEEAQGSDGLFSGLFGPLK